MADTFQPLTSGNSDSGATTFRPRVVTVQQGTESFAPLHPASFSAAAKAPCAQAQASITPLREGDRITGVRVQCSCGQLIDVQFTF